MRSAPLTTLKGGIDRLRTKGGARADSLYDLVNGHLTDSRTAVARPGTRRLMTLDPLLTKGLVYFRGAYHTFTSVAGTGVPDGVSVHILLHPDAEPSNPILLSKIHFAAPFMGVLYVVAEFEDGSTYHYWLQEVDAEAWQPDTVYDVGALVKPSTPNGLIYRATRLGAPFPSWAPGVRRSDGSGGSAYEQSVVEPTTYNGYYYVCIDTLGTNPVSGATEPTWPTERGALVVEDVDGAVSTTPTTTEPPSSNTPGSGVIGRYGSYRTDNRQVRIP